MYTTGMLQLKIVTELLYRFRSVLQSGRGCRGDTNSRMLIIQRASSNTYNNDATSNQVFIEGKFFFPWRYNPHRGLYFTAL